MSTPEFVLVPFSAEHEAAWDHVVRISSNGNFLHLRGYLGYHAHRFEERSVLVLKQGKIAAVFPCNRVGDTAISHGGLTYGGLIHGRELHATDVLAIFRLLGEHYAGSGIRKIQYKAIPSVFHAYPAQEDLYALSRMNARLYRRDLSSVIRMENRTVFSDSRKDSIRKARKYGITVREGDFVADFHAVLTDALAKFNATPVHSVEELQLLKRRFPQAIRLFGAFVGERLLAGALVYDFDHIVHTQYLASSGEGKQHGALDLVIAELIEDVFATRRYIGFGISTEREGQHLNEGLIFQKEGFGARGVVHDFYEWELL